MDNEGKYRCTNVNEHCKPANEKGCEDKLFFLWLHQCILCHHVLPSNSNININKINKILTLVEKMCIKCVS